jgi:DNA-directed RNA polymerase specialized sigma24 family protein
MGSVELPIRLAMRRFAQAVDIESVVQETFLRMWLLSQDKGRDLSGENASLRFAIGMARNIARSEARRWGREKLLPPEDLPEPVLEPDPVSDPGLRRAIVECLKKVAAKPLQALRARMDLGGVIADRDIAEGIGMTLNTFLQNIVRARKQVAGCLERGGIPLPELLS